MLRDLDERTVELMAQRSTMASFEAGEFLHQAGEPMGAVSFLSEGRAKVYRMSTDGKQQTIVLLGPGDAFGEIGIVDPRGQDLYVEALTRVVICRTTREAFLQLASRDPALAVRLAEAMGEKLQFAREQIADFAFRDIRGRVAHLLLTFLERERRLTGDDSLDRIVPGLTHRELRRAHRHPQGVRHHRTEPARAQRTHPSRGQRDRRLRPRGPAGGSRDVS